MVKQISEEIKERVYRERCERLKFFMLDGRVPAGARKWLVSANALLVLRSLHGSKLNVVRFVIRDYLSDLRIKFSTWLFFLWHRTILRKTEDELDSLIDASVGLEPGSQSQKQGEAKG